MRRTWLEPGVRGTHRGAPLSARQNGARPLSPSVRIRQPTSNGPHGSIRRVVSPVRLPPRTPHPSRAESPSRLVNPITRSPTDRETLGSAARRPLTKQYVTMEEFYNPESPVPPLIFPDRRQVQLERSQIEERPVAARLPPSERVHVVQHTKSKTDTTTHQTITRRAYGPGDYPESQNGAYRKPYTMEEMYDPETPFYDIHTPLPPLQAVATGKMREKGMVPDRSLRVQPVHISRPKSPEVPRQRYVADGYETGAYAHQYDPSVQQVIHESGSMQVPRTHEYEHYTVGPIFETTPPREHIRLDLERIEGVKGPEPVQYPEVYDIGSELAQRPTMIYKMETRYPELRDPQMLEDITPPLVHDPYAEELGLLRGKTYYEEVMEKHPEVKHTEMIEDTLVPHVSEPYAQELGLLGRETFYQQMRERGIYPEELGKDFENVILEESSERRYPNGHARPQKFESAPWDKPSTEQSRQHEYYHEAEIPTLSDAEQPYGMKSYEDEIHFNLDISRTISVGDLGMSHNITPPNAQEFRIPQTSNWPNQSLR